MVGNLALQFLEPVMKSMNDTTREIKSQALLDEFAEILAFVQTAYQ